MKNFLLMFCFLFFSIIPVGAQIVVKTEKLPYCESVGDYNGSLYEYRVSLINKSGRNLLTWIGEEGVMEKDLKETVKQHFFSRYGGDFNLCHLWWDVDRFFHDNFDIHFLVKQVKPGETFNYIFIGPILNFESIKSQIFYAPQTEVEKELFKIEDRSVFYRFPEVVVFFDNNVLRVL